MWRHYWDDVHSLLKEFEPMTLVSDRLKAILTPDNPVRVVKEDLIRELCTSDWLNLDYFGCMAEVFAGAEPPGATTWEEFVAPMFEG